MPRTNPKQKLFNGRDYSWMQFNRRVLEEAEDPANPLLERVKFLAITGNNLDEYVEVRQAGLMQRIEDGYREPGFDGLRPDESLEVLTPEIHTLSPTSTAAGTTTSFPNSAAAHPPAQVEGTRRRGPHLRARLLPTGRRPAPHSDLHRSCPPLSQSPQQGALPRAAASRQAPQLRTRRCSAWSPCPVLCRVLSACPRPMGNSTTSCFRTSSAEPRRNVSGL